MSTSTRSSGPRWEARRGFAFVLRAAILVLPLLVGIATTAALSWLVPRPAHQLGTLWLVAALAVSAVAVGLAVRLLERFLPLVALLQLSLAFPDRTPSRARLALRAGSVKRLEERVEALRAGNGPEDAATAAENVIVLAAGLTVHDRKTRGHSERVRALSELIAEEMHLDADERDRLRWASLLHDCGKVTVDAAILNKTGKLSDDEWEIIRRHPEEGARIAAPLSAWLGEWSHAIAEHHERWSGKGYPRGLQGEEISMAARIVAVADSYDAMTSLRSYQAPMTAAAAREELTRKAGVDYDPKVVRAFLRVSRGRVSRALGPMSWLTMIPLAGSDLAAAAGASVERGIAAAAIAGGGAAVAAAAALGIVAPAAVPAALAQRAPAKSGKPAPASSPEVQFAPAVAAAAAAPEGGVVQPVAPDQPAPQPAAPAPAPAARSAAAAAPPSAPAVVTPMPVAPVPSSPGPSGGGQPPSSPPPGGGSDTTPAPPPAYHVQAELGPVNVQASVSVNGPVPVCQPVDATIVKVSCG